ncbi:hypothetical protein [Janthinobacterium sp. 17J80-10]|uniref:hypothetical protein n=1 Tax=Janthinobacterium sp. 17J80-10 TaxID=2497863 RepID=UPI001005590C|nr:hypothetical protein [Janthinobacterium sp. 17J80-10]QAU35547.1 hypothetical protein EKL02_16010 [Janthinobacterium sp. 17J80-10]
MEEIKKILVTGDLMRQLTSGGSGQNGNIRWLFNLVSPALEMATNLPVSPVYFTGDDACIGTRIYAVNHAQPTFSNWVKLYHMDADARTLAVIHEAFADALVVAFELPEIVRKAFDKLGIAYVDLTIHPARFMDDLLFGLRSNIPGLPDALAGWVVYEEEIRIAAGIAAASLSKLSRLPQCEQQHNVALFAGQTSDDKVLIRGDRLMRADDFMDQFTELSAMHEKILVKPHPYARENNVVLALTRLFPNTELVEANFYHLLSHDAISKVYSLTSSTSIEAAYFGKQGIHLAPYPYAFSDESASGGTYLTIRPEIFLPQFWAGILGKSGVATQVVREVQLPRERSRMRRSLRNFWGADIFESVS